MSDWSPLNRSITFKRTLLCSLGLGKSRSASVGSTPRNNWTVLRRSKDRMFCATQGA